MFWWKNLKFGVFWCQTSGISVFFENGAGVSIMTNITYAVYCLNVLLVKNHCDVRSARFTQKAGLKRESTLSVKRVQVF